MFHSCLRSLRLYLNPTDLRKHLLEGLEYEEPVYVEAFDVPCIPVKLQRSTSLPDDASIGRVAITLSRSFARGQDILGLELGTVLGSLFYPQRRIGRAATEGL